MERREMEGNEMKTGEGRGLQRRREREKEREALERRQGGGWVEGEDNN